MSEKAAPGAWTEASHPMWPWLLAACAAATAFPLWTTAHLPVTDLPQHVAAIGTLRHWWDPAWRAQEHFALALGQTQYLLYYVAGAALAWPFGTAERANLVLLSAVAIAFPYSLRSLLRAMRQDERLALFAPVFFWSQSFLIGFFNYLAAMPVLLWGFAAALRHAEAPSRRSGVTVALLAIALFYLHLSAFMFFAPAAVVLSLLLPAPDAALLPALRERLRPPALALRLAWAIPPLLLSLLWFLQSPVANPGKVGWREPMWVTMQSPGVSLRNAAEALTDVWRGDGDELSLLLALAAAFFVAWPQQRPAEDRASTWRRAAVAGLIAFAAILYFAMPKGIGWLWQLNERYIVVIALLVPAVLRPAPGWRGAAPLLLAAAASALAAGTAIRTFRAFEREVGPFDEVIAAAEPGKRLYGMIIDQGSAVAKFSPFLHFGSYYRARQGGVSSFSFAELPQSPMRYRPEAAPPEKNVGWEWNALGAFRNDIDGAYYDYVLVHGGGGEPAPLRAPGAAWRLVKRAGRWALYARDSG